MSIEFDGKQLEWIQRGATAALVLEANQTLCVALVERVLGRVDDAVTNRRLTPAMAVGFCHELAAFRRIIAYQKQQVNQGRASEAKLAGDSNG
jgi:hypothetical protein